LSGKDNAVYPIIAESPFNTGPVNDILTLLLDNTLATPIVGGSGALNCDLRVTPFETLIPVIIILTAQTILC